MPSSSLNRGTFQPGDRAIVIREHCVTKPLGKIVTIGHRLPSVEISCPKCFCPVTLPIINIIHETDGDGFWPIAWLRKLPPVSETEEREEEITA